MSADNEQKGTSGTDDQGSADDQKNSVNYDTYSRTLSQVKQGKVRQKELEEENAALRAEKEAENKARLEEDNKYKELWEASETKAKEAQAQAQSLQEAQTRATKRAAVAQHIGEVSNPEYLNFIDLSKVDLDDSESIKAEADRFKATHPTLLKQAPTNTHTSAAPGNAIPTGDKSHSKMTDAELDAALCKTF